MLLVGATQLLGCGTETGLSIGYEPSAEARALGDGTTAVYRQRDMALEPPPYDPRAVQPNEPSLSDGQVKEAVDIAFDDERLSDFLAAHEHSVREVREAAGNHITVAVCFKEPVPPERGHHPLDLCDVDVKSENVTGVVWLVNTKIKEVGAVSPEWDYGTSCVPGD